MANQLTSIDFFCPSIAAKNERNVLRLFLYGTGGTMATIDIYAIPPSGQALLLDTTFTDVSGSFPATFVSQFEAPFTFQIAGLYTFIVHDTSTGDVWIDKTYCAEWASRIDIPVSQLNKQRADIQRIYGKVKGN
jgi:hypothetical protein